MYNFFMAILKFNNDKQCTQITPWYYLYISMHIIIFNPLWPELFFH